MLNLLKNDHSVVKIRPRIKIARLNSRFLELATALLQPTSHQTWPPSCHHSQQTLTFITLSSHSEILFKSEQSSSAIAFLPHGQFLTTSTAAAAGEGRRSQGSFTASRTLLSTAAGAPTSASLFELRFRRLQGQEVLIEVPADPYPRPWGFRESHRGN